MRRGNEIGCLKSEKGYESGERYCALSPCGKGSSLLLQVLMGEGVDCENPSPIRIRAHTIVPSPARGEGTKAHASRWRMLAKRSHVAS